MGSRAYRPFGPAKRPGAKPGVAPVYRVLVHQKFKKAWLGLPGSVGMESAQQFWDHVSQTPGTIPELNGSCILRGAAGRPKAEGFSRTVHYEISGAGRIDYQFNDAYLGRDGDPHAVVWILTIDLSSH